MLFVFLEKLINEAFSSCLKEMKNSFTLTNSIVSIHSNSLSCILSELISFEQKSLQYLHAFDVDLTKFLLVPLKWNIAEKDLRSFLYSQWSFLFQLLWFDDRDIFISSIIFIVLFIDHSTRRLSSASEMKRSSRILLALNSLFECTADCAARYPNLARYLSQFKLLVGRFFSSLDIRLLICIARGVTSSSLAARYSPLLCSSTPTAAWAHISPSK